jgi:ABC-type uncharacterized transport system permease subunit
MKFDVPVAVLLVLPYVLAVFVAAGLVGTSKQPAASTLQFRHGG